ncbi:hypothetical protein GCM10017673_46340 [Streptosporangium violaceochromogenes]|nr:hypothetical protein GCM10017673_46340 [Streptosporangium violaceochromogenes]
MIATTIAAGGHQVEWARSADPGAAAAPYWWECGCGSGGYRLRTADAARTAATAHAKSCTQRPW